MEMRHCYFEGEHKASIYMTRKILSRSKCIKQSVEEKADNIDDDVMMILHVKAFRDAFFLLEHNLLLCFLEIRMRHLNKPNQKPKY